MTPLILFQWAQRERERRACNRLMLGIGLLIVAAVVGWML